MGRQGFEDARKIFQDLLNDEGLTMPGRVEATSFALGDLTLTELGAGGDETLGKLTQATNAFHEIIPGIADQRRWRRSGQN